MVRESKQHPRSPVQSDSYIYTAENENPEPPEYITAVPEHDVDGFHGKVLAFEQVFAKIIYWALVFFGLALAALMFTQVLLRYVFLSPFVGIEEIGLLFGVWFYFLGMAYVTRNGEHIHGGILTLVVKNPHTVRKVRFVLTLLSIIAASIFAFYAIRYAIFEIEKGRVSSYMRWPKWWWSSSLIIGFGGMVFYFILQITNQFLDLKSTAPQGEEKS
ncbi:TRAP-type C4-dicarboxylate transport system permease small subunit [Pacificibacter maritimus]|uniref:TRAP transporter small permease protein n=1 Tax=Pacificibacter maritimus TaxID=762213 RepID=A0A3N4UNJ9_9RHOB|nr:TRAP transporter small permease [Pacificibacter maritimus]RPE66607.1 TRAP-type C4-dicarboxylate transport system permease small subunit [Pacificibacter maritimus]